MPELLDLPDACLAIILQHLPTAHSLASAMATHSQIAAVGHSYPETWRPLAEQVAWCLRRRCDEGWGELCKRAHCGAARQRLVAIGGAQQIFIPSIDDAAVDVYEIGNEASDGAWQAANPLGRARDAPCAASDGRRVHVLGGWDGKADCALTCGESAEFDEHGIALCWEALPELPEPRCFAAAVCDEQERLWVVGGGDSLYRGARCLSAVDLLMGDGWSRAGTLLEPRCGLALAASARRSELVVCGGYSGDVAYLSSVESFDMMTGRQSRIPSMTHHRSGLGACFGPDGGLYVVGGSEDGSNALSACERLDPREGKWHRLEDMQIARGYLAASFSLDGRLYAAGGADSTGRPLDAFEIYEPRAGKWRHAPPLPSARANLALVLMA
uniref:F-box domain-containing protein n=1 Tax=Haptolina ericina TaxID=156174 RepID=A0A7S3BNV1_9EUKA|mmetsp:Transcript_62643/g.139494  ORF Transcript_62643/g.139494 Transcript_62643/m.139494 type:complete len:385 (+) Transcript_62643:45-1199(+)